MPMDDYDMRHTCDYNDSNTMNIYCNDNAIKKIQIWCELLTISDEKVMCQLKIDMEETVKSLREGLGILDARSITCISARVCYCIVDETRHNDARYYPKAKWILVNVWRA